MTIDNKIKEPQCISVDDEIELDSTKCNTGVDMDNDEHVPSTAAEGGDKLEVEMEPQQDGERTETHENKDSLPIDKGWAWVVLAGACFCFILLGGIKRNFGIFFLAIQDRFGSTASVTSLVATTRKVFNSFTCKALIAMTVWLQFMSNRMAVMFGALVYTISNIISAFATDIRILFATLGCLEGTLVHKEEKLFMMTINKNIKESQSTCVEDEFELDSTTGVENIHHQDHATSTKADGDTSNPQLEGERTKRKLANPNDSGLPIDNGWAWVVLAGAIFCLIQFGGIKKNFGIFFVSIQDRFGSTASVTSLVATSQRLINSFTSLIAMTIGMQFMSNRTAVIFGALVYTIANIISAFATDIRVLFASVGCLEGIARACVHPPLTVSILEYFNKKRGLANGLAFCGVSLGGLIFAPIFPVLFEKLGYSGTFIIAAGMTLSFVLTGALIRPLNSLDTKTHIKTQGNGKAKNDDKSERGPVDESQETLPENLQEDKSHNMKVSFLDKLKTSFDITLFKSLVFPMFLLMAAMLSVSDILLVFLAPLSKDIGLTANQIGILMTVAGCGGLLSRILCAVFADREFMNATTLLAVVSTIAGITAHFARFFKSFSLLVVMAVLLGLTCEIYHSLYPVVLVEYMTLPKVKSCMGFTMLCHGVAVASTYPVVGWLRDTTGNYYASYHFLGTMPFIGALCALSLPHVHRRSKRK